jgi:transposase
MLSFHFTLYSNSRKKLRRALTDAQSSGNIGLAHRIRAILALDSGHSFDDVASIFSVTVKTVKKWLENYLLKGLKGLLTKKRRGRPSRLKKSQKRELSRLIEAGPSESGFPGNCWRSPMIQQMIWDRFRVIYSAKYISQLLRNLGFSYHKACFESDHLDHEKRKDWIERRWPKILAEAKVKNAYLLFCDEASFPQWGTLAYTWGRKGQKIKIKTSGKRKGYKVFGAIDYFTGRLFFHCQEGSFNSRSYAEFIQGILYQTRKQIILIHDNARYHTCGDMQDYFDAHDKRLTVYELPTYSPDYNPIERLWKKIKERGIHLHYFPTYESLKDKVYSMLLEFLKSPNEVLSLFAQDSNLSPSA